MEKIVTNGTIAISNDKICSSKMLIGGSMYSEKK